MSQRKQLEMIAVSGLVAAVVQANSRVKSPLLCFLSAPKELISEGRGWRRGGG